jgi:hypothetical protein
MARWRIGDYGDLPPVPPIDWAHPVPPEELPVDMFCCSLCGATLWLAAQMEVEHDCATGYTGPA